METKAVKKHTRACAVEYWKNVNVQDQLERLKDKYDIFNVEKWAENSNFSMIVDVGAGGLGGIFQCIQGRNNIVVDIAAESFREMGNLPVGLAVMETDFSEIHLSNGSVDLLFAWEVLDHAFNEVHFRQGQEEFVRVLKPGGFLFFNHLFRDKSIDFHLLGPSYESVIVGFRKLRLVWEEFRAVNDSEWYAIYRK